jgi:hypothetical protein
VIFNLKDPKNSTKKLLDNINTFSKIERHKINVKESVVFLYNINEQTEKEIRKTIPFTLDSKNTQE